MVFSNIYFYLLNTYLYNIHRLVGTNHLLVFVYVYALYLDRMSHTKLMYNVHIYLNIEKKKINIFKNKETLLIYGWFGYIYVYSSSMSQC